MSDEYTQQLEETNEKLRKRLEEETTRADKLQGELDKLKYKDDRKIATNNGVVRGDKADDLMKKWEKLFRQASDPKVKF